MILIDFVQNKLHLSKDEVKQFYRTHPAHSHESWYITPVGNPSGTKMTPIQLTVTIEAIAEQNPKAVIILDSVVCNNSHSYSYSYSYSYQLDNSVCCVFV